LGFLSRGDY